MKKQIIIGSVVGLTAAVLAREVIRRKTNNARAKSDESEVTAAGSSLGKIENGEVSHPIDDQGTNQSQASEILTYIRDNAFDGSNEKLALALGRPAGEIENWTNGSEVIDGDGLMKARALAIQRGLDDQQLSGPQSM